VDNGIVGEKITENFKQWILEKYPKQISIFLSNFFEENMQRI
jgi:hypothetical protein